MADVDYDAPRAAVTEPEADSFELLKERRAESVRDDLAELDFTDSYQLPGYDLLEEELTVPVIPVQPDEFRCAGCFLVLHWRMTVGVRRGEAICRDCA